MLLICRVWKEITLNSTSDQVEYRVWDYPIKEQYGHILQAITQVGPVRDTKEGFRKVDWRIGKRKMRTATRIPPPNWNVPALFRW